MLFHLQQREMDKLNQFHRVAVWSKSDSVAKWKIIQVQCIWVFKLILKWYWNDIKKLKKKVESEIRKWTWFGSMVKIFCLIIAIIPNVFLSNLAVLEFSLKNDDRRQFSTKTDLSKRRQVLSVGVVQLFVAVKYAL